MTDQTTESSVSAPRTAARPPITDRAAFQAELDELRVKEKAHTRAGDALAAANDADCRWSRSIRRPR